MIEFLLLGCLVLRFGVLNLKFDFYISKKNLVKNNEF